MRKFNSEHNVKTGMELFLSSSETQFESDSGLVELQEGVWYFLESGVHTKNGKPIIEGEFQAIEPSTLSAPQSPDQE